MPNQNLREKIIDEILKVAMAHHDDISKSDEDNAIEAAERIIKLIDIWTLDEILKKVDCIEKLVKRIEKYNTPHDWQNPGVSQD